MIRFSKNKIGLDIVILRNLHDLCVIYKLIQEMTNLFPKSCFECYIFGLRNIKCTCYLVLMAILRMLKAWNWPNSWEWLNVRNLSIKEFNNTHLWNLQILKLICWVAWIICLKICRYMSPRNGSILVVLELVTGDTKENT